MILYVVIFLVQGKLVLVAKIVGKFEQVFSDIPIQLFLRCREAKLKRNILALFAKKKKKKKKRKPIYTSC